MKLCPCGSNKRYLDCCGACIQLKKPAETPEALMRSRYTAYTEENYDYIKKTMRPPASYHFKKKAVAQKAKTEGIKWIGLEVIAASIDFYDPNIGYVTYKAHYQCNGESRRIYEESKFRLMEGKWYYVDGKQAVANKSVKNEE